LVNLITRIFKKDVRNIRQKCALYGALKKLDGKRRNADQISVFIYDTFQIEISPKAIYFLLKSPPYNRHVIIKDNEHCKKSIHSFRTKIFLIQCRFRK